MKKLIAYYSFSENNKKLAEFLLKELNCDLVRIETVKKRSGLSILLDLIFKRKPEVKQVPYYLRDYDHIIFIAPIWASKIAMPLTSFMKAEKSNVKSYSFITVCGGRPGQKEKITKELVATIGKAPLSVVELWTNNLKNEPENGLKRGRIDRLQLEVFGKDIVGFLSGIELESLRATGRIENSSANISGPKAAA
jgi:flavodoxin